jgi:hypothetical protein
MLCVLLLCERVTLNDIAIGIWSGVEVFHERVVPMSWTWFTLVPSVHVYSDELRNSSLELILNGTNHLNVHFHETPTFAHYMVGTQWDNKWNNVQNRHLYALGDLYFREPTRKWYFLGDDDTFLYPNVLCDFLSDCNETNIHGRIFFAFEHVNFAFRHPDATHIFVQGGAGIVIPHDVMSRLAAKMENCTQIFSGVNFPSDMRLAACLERLFNYSVVPGPPGIFLFPLGAFNSDTPMKERAVAGRPPITYHHIVPPLVNELWMAAFSVWTDAADVDHFVDWSWLTMKEIRFELGTVGFWVDFQFGFRIYFAGERGGKQLRVLSQPEPVFEDRERLVPKRFVQRFEGGFEIVYQCDEALENQTIVFDSFLLPEDGCVFRVLCPPVRTFPVTHPGTESPWQVTRSPIHEL